jgi:hypothetical protein
MGLSNIVFNGGVPVYVPMRPEHSEGNGRFVAWKLDMDELRFATELPSGLSSLDVVVTDERSHHVPK